MQAILGVCNKLLVMMLNCWQFNELLTLQNFQFTSSVLCLRQSVCWNLAATNVIIIIIIYLLKTQLKLTMVM